MRRGQETSAKEICLADWPVDTVLIKGGCDNDPPFFYSIFNLFEIFPQISLMGWLDAEDASYSKIVFA